MNKKIITVGLAGPALLMASLLASCGGGGGGASSFTPTNITTKEEATVSSQGTRVVNEILSLGTEQLNTLSNQKSEGFLKAVLKTLEGKDLSNISTKEVINCDAGGNMELVQTGDTAGYIEYNNCQLNECETVNGRLEITFKDINNNDIPENISLLLKKGFSYRDTCENNSVEIRNDFSMALNGKLPNRDIYTEGGMKLKAEIVLNGGEIIANDAGRQSLAHFYNLTFYGNEADNEIVIEYSIDGGISYKTDCMEEAVNAVYETIQMFREYVNADCPYEGKLVINDGQVTLEAYDPDNDIKTPNNVKITFGENVIFDNDCTQLESLGVCPE